MSYFDVEDNVDGYLKMVADYDGGPLIATFAERVPAGARVLEIGMGGGADLDLLAEAGYEATGSDASSVFLQRYADRGGRCPTLQLDARLLDTDQRYDALFSNKVLQHLTLDEMAASLRRQAALLEPGGVAFHTLWRGEDCEEHHGMLFTQYTRARLEELLPESLEIVELVTYDEMAPGDSLWVLLRRPDAATTR